MKSIGKQENATDDSRRNQHTDDNRRNQQEDTMADSTIGNSALSRKSVEDRSAPGADSELDKRDDVIPRLANRTREVASNVAHKAQDYGEKALDQTGMMVRRYPAAMLCGGFGVGLIFGFFLSRRW